LISNTYKPGNSFIHHSDPRIKIFLLVFVTISFFLTGIIFLTSLYLLLILLLIGISCSSKEILIPLKSIFPILIFVALLTPPFHTGGTPYLKVGSIILLSSKGILETLRLIIRFTGITGIFFLFFRTTSIDDFILSLRWYHVPYTATLLLTIALRYIPHMVTLYTQVTNAHKLRCGWNDLDRKEKLITKIKKIFPILVSVLIQSIKAIPTLAMALELKGFGSSLKRTHYLVIRKYYSFPLQLILLFVIVLAVLSLSFL